MIADPSLDAVYVATLHTDRAAKAESALRAGRAVLCEKPLAPDSETVRRMFDVAQTSRSSLLEGYM